MSAAVPGAPLQDILPDILAGLRFLPRSVGYQPYLVAFKQYPYCLGTGLDVPGADVEDVQGNVAA